MSLPSTHPLHRLFTRLVRRHFFHEAQVPDPEIADYVAGVLTDFTHVEHLYRIRDARGRRLDEVARMLVASNPLLEASSFDRERAVRKHIGDYTLFFTGLFPESVAALPRLRPLSLDAFLDYVRAGKESYAIVGAFDLFEYRHEAPLFRRLADRFEQCVFGLNLVRDDLRLLEQGFYQQLREELGLDRS
jgi:hypothetical protein